MSPVGYHRENPLLRVADLCVRLPTDHGVVHALNGVSFALDNQKTLAIVGESGCGKSILCRTILGLLPHTAIIAPESRVFYNGRDLIGLGEADYNRLRAVALAMVFQDPLSSLNPVMKIGRQIAEVLIHHERKTQAAANNLAIDLLQSVGVPDPQKRIDQYPHQLSGGMRQRVAIAIALACKPNLLIADEPTTALDVTIQEGILDLLGELQMRRKMAMLLVTHDLRMAASRAHHIAVMYAGKIVEQAPTAIIFNHMAMPYTKALIDTIPSLDNSPHTPLNSIDGQPPNLLNPICGCAFAPRCIRAKEKCYSSSPPLLSGPVQNHLVACWYPLGGPA
jgi:peptide/nickel transport system ATP-binding protein